MFGMAQKGNRKFEIFPNKNRRRLTVSCSSRHKIYFEEVSVVDKCRNRL